MTKDQNLGVCQNPDVETEKYVFSHTMLRIKDPQITLDFYTRILGMKLLQKLDFAEWKFSLYFLAYVPHGISIPTDAKDNAAYTFGS